MGSLGIIASSPGLLLFPEPFRKDVCIIFIISHPATVFIPFLRPFLTTLLQDYFFLVSKEDFCYAIVVFFIKP